MPLELPKLDDLTFQQIVDHAKSRIQLYCPEWTDHNVHDPGIALIELFAEMVEMLLYRVNRLPDSVHLTLLNLLGFAREAPIAAKAPVTFYLASAAKAPVPIEKETEVSTVRTEVSAPITFTTIKELEIKPPAITVAFRLLKRQYQPSNRLTLHAGRFREDETISETVALFRENEPEAGDAFYIGLDGDYSKHVLRLRITCHGLPTGVDTASADSPIVWECSADEDSASEWLRCEVDEDLTGYLSKSGTITLRMPDRMQSKVLINDRQQPLADDQGRVFEAFWLRCRLRHTHPSYISAARSITTAPARNAYTASPQLRSLRIECIGGTVMAEHATIVTNEYLGESDGSTGQTFRLRHAPILGLGEEDLLIVKSPDGMLQKWKEVTHFADPTLEALGGHGFVLDHFSGTITLPPVLPQLEQGVYRYGVKDPSEPEESGAITPAEAAITAAPDDAVAPDDNSLPTDKKSTSLTSARVNGSAQARWLDIAPSAGSKLFFQRYRYWDGEHGNVAAGTLTVLTSDSPFNRVTNWQHGSAHRSAESLESLKLRAARELRSSRDVAVTAPDFEYLALKYYPGSDDDLARVHCIAPTRSDTSAAALAGTRPGLARVVVFPRISKAAASAYLPNPLPDLSETIRTTIEEQLQTRSVLGCTVQVERPKLVYITISAQVYARQLTTQAARRELADTITQQLHAYLNPYTGGPDAQGWPFGRGLAPDELRGLIQAIRGVDRVVIDTAGSSAVRPRPEALETFMPPESEPFDREIALRPDEVICSGEHKVIVLGKEAG